MPKRIAAALRESRSAMHTMLREWRFPTRLQYSPSLNSRSIGSRLVLALALLLAAATCASAGPVLDEILNYMFMDQSVPMKGPEMLFDVQRTIDLTKQAPIGQTFVTGPETYRIVLIRVFVGNNSEWKPGEGAELVLWDSPEKKVSHGRYTIWYDYRGYHYQQAEFEVNATVKPNTEYYFEIGYVGVGDDKLSGVGVKNGTDSCPRGQGYLGGQQSDFDVCFQVHSKRKMDRVGNLKKAFARFDLSRPEFSAVKQAVDIQDFEAAVARIVAYFEARTKPTSIIEANHIPRRDPDYDTTAGDLAMQNYFMKRKMGEGYAGPDLNWRAHVDFDENGRQIAGDFDLNWFGARGIVTAAYLNTRNQKYAKKFNDMMIDWFIDNPPPTQSNTGGCAWDPVWSSLSTGVRLRHSFVAYSRAHTSPLFTTDCRFAWILDLADHADTLVMVGEGAGGNWSFTQNSSMLSFALDFPEFVNSPKWFETAARRISASLDKDWLPDGVETESAPGYQRFSYSPLVGIYELMQERGVKAEFADKLRGLLETQAEYYIYITMPDGLTPFLGDWGHTQERPTLEEDAQRFSRPDMLYVATAGSKGTKPKELSKLYPYAGIVTTRSDWGDAGAPYEDARYLMLHGVHYGAHGHHDINAVTLHAYGRELLIDPGSYIYGSPEHDLLTRAVSHNLMTIDGQDQNIWSKLAFRNWATTPVADYLSSWAGVYRPGAHTREVFYIRSNGDPGALDYWVVRDTMDGSSDSHLLEQRWHLAMGDVTVDKYTLTSSTQFDDGGNLAILQVDPSRLEAMQTEQDTWRYEGTAADPTKLPTVIYSANTALPAAVHTVLLPFEGSVMPSFTVKSLETSADGLDSAFKVTQGPVTDVFVYQRSASQKTLASEGISFDGERLFVRKTNGKLRSAFLINGTSLNVDGQQIIRATKPVMWVSVSLDDSGVTAYAGSEDAGLSFPAFESGKVSLTSVDTPKSLDPAGIKEKK